MKIEILEFSGESCANCFSLMPVVNGLAAARGIGVRHIEVSPEHAAEVSAYAIERVPTLLLLADGKEFARCTGYQPEEILEVWLDAKTEEIREKCK